MQALAANGVRPYYWTHDNRYEVDFIFQNARGDIIPLEIKSSEHTTSKSLSVYTARYKPPYAMRASQKNFGFENDIKSIPLYALFCVDDKILNVNEVTNAPHKARRAENYARRASA